MKSFVGIGKGNPQSAVSAATQGLTSPSLIIFMSPYEAAADVAALLKEKYPEALSIGTIGTSLANGSVGDGQLVVVGLFQDANVSAGVIENVSSCPIAAIGELEKNINKVSPGRDNTVCIEFCTCAEEMLVTTFQAVIEKKGVQLAGGTVFGVPEGKPSIVAYNGKIYENACAYAVIKNTTGRVKVYKENIYQKRADGVAHFATKVDVSKKAVVELDGRPAAEVYSKEIGIPKDKIVDNVLLNPMGRAVGDQVFIASMNKLEADGSLQNYKRINKNDCMYFLELGDYEESEIRTRDNIKSEMKHISLVLSIDCIYRYLLYDQKGYFGTYAKGMASLGNHAGIVGGGEQFNNQHVNQTMVCAVFE
ncbi:MAG: hypothetical protein J6B68_02355 [Lachnospiraceae bacterium]|nr:hypothetical protein [Lachnospiraceae bacterium]